MKSFSKKLIATVLAVIMIATIAIPVFAENTVEYTITNPYETVDWETWGQYKAMLHAHTLYSDGEMDVKDVVEEYYALDYDILAITDHGVVNKGWDKKPEMLPLIGYNQYIKWLTPMSAERYAEITSGADRDGRGMLDVSQGIEMNGVVMRKNHVNGFFCGYGQGDWGKEEDYEGPVAGTDAAGGISFINHPGDFYAVHHDIEKASDPEILKTWTDIFLKYDSCVGVEVYNERDTVARYDRIIWDNLLMYTIPRGRNIWAFANDDSHFLSTIGVTAEMMLMPENTEENLRTAMENGTFFACSTISKVEMGEEFRGTGDYAKVTNIVVDEENDIITATIESTTDYTVEWVADGEIIATGDSINLRDYSEEIGSYVRFQIKNEGGIVLSQPFVCDDGNMEACMVYYPEEPEYPEIVKFFMQILEKLRKNIIGELIYRAIELDNM